MIIGKAISRTHPHTHNRIQVKSTSNDKIHKERVEYENIVNCIEMYYSALNTQQTIMVLPLEQYLKYTYKKLQ